MRCSSCSVGPSSRRASVDANGSPAPWCASECWSSVGCAVVGSTGRLVAGGDARRGWRMDGLEYGGNYTSDLRRRVVRSCAAPAHESEQLPAGYLGV
jgi:hypothetical protein